MTQQTDLQARAEKLAREICEDYFGGKYQTEEDNARQSLQRIATERLAQALAPQGEAGIAATATSGITSSIAQPSRRQIVMNWLMGEADLTQKDGWWSGSEGIAAIDELLSALDVSPAPQGEAGQPLLNVSDANNEWNKQALITRLLVPNAELPAPQPQVKRWEDCGRCGAHHPIGECLKED